MSPVNGEVLALVAGGGPAPGINGVISAATIEAINNGMQVIGIYDGFKWLATGDMKHIRPLGIPDVSRIHLSGGSIIRTSRENPSKSKEKLKNVVRTLKALKVNYLITIGGDDTAYTASIIEQEMRARHLGVNLIQNIMEDAQTTGRWYFVVTMGRKAGHLALGIGKASGATLTIISEEFKDQYVSLKQLCDILEGAMIKRKSMGRDDGVAILAEGLAERFNPDEELKKLGHIELDEFDHIRLSELDLGKILKDEIKRRFEQRGQEIPTPVTKDIGYELRCAPLCPSHTL
jgi:6-phosphofructokinase 1